MKKPEYHRQLTLENCGISCLLMALDAFGVDYPTIARERQLYAMLRSKAAPGTEGAALALGLARRHLDVTLVHSCPSLIDNSSGYYPPDLHQALLAECQDCIRRGEGLFTLEAGVPVTCQRLRQELLPWARSPRQRMLRAPQVFRQILFLPDSPDHLSMCSYDFLPRSLSL